MPARCFPRVTKEKASAVGHLHPHLTAPVAEELVRLERPHLPNLRPKLRRTSSRRKRRDDLVLRSLFRLISINYSNESFLFLEFPSVSIRNYTRAVTVPFSISRPRPVLTPQAPHTGTSSGV